MRAENPAIIPEGKLPTMIVDSVEVNYDPGKLEGAEVYITDMPDQMYTSFKESKVHPTRAAIYVDKTGIVESMSVPEALQGGSISKQEAKGFKLHSTSDGFSCLIVNGGTYKLKDLEIVIDSESDGRTSSDFTGYGTAICLWNGAKATVENARIYVRGVVRSATFIDTEAHLLMKNSEITVMGGKHFEGYRNNVDPERFREVPWVLGLTGSARATQLMGKMGSATYVDCVIRADSWGVMSTDVGRDTILTVIDSELMLLGQSTGKNPFVQKYGSGYGTYAHGRTEEFLYGAHLKVGTYAGIANGGAITYASSKNIYDIITYQHLPNGKPKYTMYGREYIPYCEAKNKQPVYGGIMGSGRNSVIESEGFGFMGHCFYSYFNILDGTVVNTRNAIFLHKGGKGVFRADNAVLNPADGVLVQVMDDDDLAIGLTEEMDFNQEYNEKPGYPGLDYEAPGMAGDDYASAIFTNMSMKGNMFNSSGYVIANEAASWNEGASQGRPLNVMLGAGASLEGYVQCSSSIHVDENGNPVPHFTIKQYYYLGHVANKPHYNGVNDIKMVLTDGAKWVVTDYCLLTDLAYGEDCSITGVDGKALKVVVDGIETALESGMRLKGKIEIFV